VAWRRVLHLILVSFFDGPQRQASLAQHFGFLFQVFRVDRWFQ